MKKIGAITEKVLKKIKPSKAEIEKEQEIVKFVLNRIRKIKGKHLDAIVAGSIARNTHLKGDRDIDIFILFDHKLTREEFEKEGLRIGKAVFRGYKWEEAYSEHPYIRGTINGFDVEIVPSYKVESTALLQSAVDRTPFHNRYLMERLGEKQKDEIRLLRQFLKGIKCYGADLKTSSIPGYVVELLILKYGTFENAIRAIAKWRRREVIDIENYYPKEEALKMFNSPLVVIDPVDRNRNVGAALSLDQYARMIAAARAFIKKPSEKFFFPKAPKELPLKKVKKILQKKEIVGIKIGWPKVHADILWGQLRRLRKKIATALESYGFKVVRSEDWSDEKEQMLILFEVESCELQRTMKRIGPEVSDEENSERFLKAHKKIVTGPWIENGRWAIEVERKYYNIFDFLNDYLKKLKKEEKEAARKALRKKALVLDEKGLIALYKKSSEFRKFFTSYLKGKEEFL